MYRSWRRMHRSFGASVRAGAPHRRCPSDSTLGTRRRLHLISDKDHGQCCPGSSDATIGFPGDRMRRARARADGMIVELAIDTGQSASQVNRYGLDPVIRMTEATGQYRRMAGADKNDRMQMFRHARCPYAPNCAITVRQRRSRGRWASRAYSRASSPFLVRDAYRAWGARRGS